MIAVCALAALVATAAKRSTNGARFEIKDLFVKFKNRLVLCISLVVSKIISTYVLPIHFCHLRSATSTKYMRALKTFIKCFSHISASMTRTPSTNGHFIIVGNIYCLQEKIHFKSN
jgi:hypothetical protein